MREIELHWEGVPVGSEVGEFASSKRGLHACCKRGPGVAAAGLEKSH